MWVAPLDDLVAGLSAERIAARFHLGLAEALAARAAQAHGIETVALSGGVFQNHTLFEAVAEALRARSLRVLIHTQVSANDGGLALGQAAIAALADGP